MQYARLGRFVDVRAPAPCKLHRLLLTARNVPCALFREVRPHLFPQPAQLGLCGVPAVLDYQRVYPVVQKLRAPGLRQHRAYLRRAHRQRLMLYEPDPRAVLVFKAALE